MTDDEHDDDDREPTGLEVLPETEPTYVVNRDGFVRVPTARGIYGELTDWQLVPVDVAAEWDVGLWGPLR